MDTGSRGCTERVASHQLWKWPENGARTFMPHPHPRSGFLLPPDYYGDFTHPSFLPWGLMTSGAFAILSPETECALSGNSHAE